MNHSVYFLVIGCLATANCFALQPAPIELGELNIVPKLTVGTSYDDNPFSQNSNQQEQFISTIKPSVLLLMRERENLISANLSATKGLFHHSSDDSFTDYQTTVNGHIQLNNKNSIDASIGYSKGHEDRGSAATQGLGQFVAGPTEFDDTRLNVSYQLGASSSTIRTEFMVDYLDRSYDLNVVELGNRDREENSLSGKAFYSVSGKTDIVAEIRHTDIDYTNETAARKLNTLDNSELEYFIGAQWQGAAKTSGFAKIGFGDKDFDSSSRPDESGNIAWAIGVSWALKQHSLISLTSSAEEEETTGSGNFIDTEIYQISWEHEWKDNLATTASYTYRDEQYSGSLQSDTLDQFGIKCAYQFKRWMDINIGYEITEKSSSINNFDYDRNKLFIQLVVSL